MKLLVVILVVLLLATNLFWIYTLYDSSISLDHSRTSEKITNNELDLLAKLGTKLNEGISYRVVEDVIGKHFDSVLVKKRKNAIFLDSIVLIFADGKLEAIKELNNLSSEEYNYVDELK